MPASLQAAAQRAATAYCRSAWSGTSTRNGSSSLHAAAPIRRAAAGDQSAISADSVTFATSP